MPITFEEMVQTVINCVREKEQAMQAALQLDKRVKELEAQLVEVARVNADRCDCDSCKPKSVREPDKKLTLQPLQKAEVKNNG